MRTPNVVVVAVGSIGVIAAAAVLYRGSTARSESNSGTAPALAASDARSEAVAVERTDKVIAYYFHWTSRCTTCLEIEEYSAMALREEFGDELDTGRLDWRPCNMELPDHSHFQSDFDLSTPSLVLVRIDDGKRAEWKVLAQVWDLVHWPPELEAYVTAETGAFLAAAAGS